MQKYEDGLTDDQLDKKISDTGGELLPKESASSNNQQVIVDGYIFEIDRSAPKVVEYVGRADGVIITAQVSQNEDWQNPTATVKGTIKTYASGERITSSSASVTSGSADVSRFPTEGGDYTISGITEDTTIEITATDSKENNVTKEVEVKIVKDTTPPILTNAKAEANKMKIKISVNAKDNESGLNQIKYSVSPTTISPSEGTLTLGQVIELTATEEKEYIVTFTAEDKAGNISTLDAKATTIDAMPVAEAKATINASNIKDYIGEKVDYNPLGGGTWRVFYYDDENYFGDGIGTLYLKRDYVSNDKTTLSSYTNYIPKDGGAMMKQMNPKWRDSTAHSELIDLVNEHCVAWLCDPLEWENYKVEGIAKYAIGSPSVEMYIKAFNVWKTGNKDANNLICKMDDTSTKYGYMVGANGKYVLRGSATNDNAIEAGPNNIFMTPGANFWWLASPSSTSTNYIMALNCGVKRVAANSDDVTYSVCPIVSLNH